MGWIGIAAFAVTLLGWISYPIINKIPGVRRTMWPLWMFFLLGFAVAAAALLLGRTFSGLDRALAQAAIGNLPLFLFFYFFMMRTPRAKGRPEIGQRLPHFELPSDEGKVISPDDFNGKGPVLLVFFRGFW